MIHQSGELSLKTTNGKWVGSQPWSSYIAALGQQQKRTPNQSGANVHAGLVVEGTLVDLRAHRLLPAPAQNFIVLTVDVENSKRRTFDAAGGETSDFNKPKEELVRKGYLHHHDVRAIDDPSRLTIEQLSSILKPFYANSTSSDSSGVPPKASRLEFWGETSLLKPMNLNVGDKIHLKTKFDIPFVESLTVHKVTQSKTYHGEDVVGGWGGKIFASKDPSSVPSSTSSPSATEDGAADDEWN